MSYNPTQPHNLNLLPPKKSIKNSDFSNVLLKARVELAELKGSAGQIPNPLLLTAPLLIRESVESSGIENINTTVAKVLENQLLPEDEQKKPDKEVLRYREALYWGAQNIDSISISNRLILGIHKKLIVKNGGEYRRKQNQIVNSKTGEVLYTPPVQSRIPELIGNWENYVNNNKDLDPLIRAAIAHQQFESIHPFIDGNGRTGRILMVLQLVKEELLELPILFISGYINKNRSEYYKLLLEVSSNDNWHEFITFMLQGFYSQANETKETLKKISSYHYGLKQQIKTDHDKIYSADLLEKLFSYPVITPTKLASELGIHYTTASRHLSILSEAGILHSVKMGRNHFFVNKKLVSILSK
jgi:Fic family protein